MLDYTNDGFDLQTDNGELWCYPFISIMLGDFPENAALTLTFNSANCSHPCHACLVEGDKLNNAELSDDQIVLRTTSIELLTGRVGSGQRLTRPEVSGRVG